jgi:hypothetical protein
MLQHAFKMLRRHRRAARPEPGELISGALTPPHPRARRPPQGTVGFNAQGAGFWLTHSAPEFPRFPNTTNFTAVAKSQQTYGQHFFCASLGSAAMEVALQHLLVSKVGGRSSLLWLPPLHACMRQALLTGACT